MPPNVRELVREDRLDLLRRQAGQRRDRQQHHRPQPSDDDRAVDERRVHHADEHV